MLSCIGIAINSFYCCGKLKFVSLRIGAIESSAKHGSKDNCCKHNRQSFKVKDSHISSNFFTFNYVAPVAILSPQFFDNEPADHYQHAGLFYNTHAPPGLTYVSLYKFICNYRI